MFGVMVVGGEPLAPWACRGRDEILNRVGSPYWSLSCRWRGQPSPTPALGGRGVGGGE